MCAPPNEGWLAPILIQLPAIGPATDTPALHINEHLIARAGGRTVIEGLHTSNGARHIRRSRQEI
jgi:hypothetical protein